MSHIEIKDLKVSYGNKTILNGINLKIPDRQITTIIGPSGCGKTTLLKSINRLLELQENVKVSGAVFIDDENIYAPGVDVISLRKKVGFIPQRPCPLPMSIYENVAFGARIHKLTPDQIRTQIKKIEKNNGVQKESTGNHMDELVEHYLRLAGLWEEVKDRLRSPATALSIGQQQRLALARALAIEPKVILADEPTSALDPISSKLIEEQFKTLKQHYTIIVVTHILRQARRMADYVAFMYLGDLIEHSPAEQFFSDPKKKETKAYISGEIS